MSSASDEVRNRLDDVVDRAGLPEWVDTTELKAELFKVVDRLLKSRAVTEPMIEAACEVVIGFSGDYGDNDYLSREAAEEVLTAALGAPL